VVDDLSKGLAENVPAGCEIVTGDLADLGVARQAFDGVEMCFHLAAKIGGIGYFHRYPADILDRPVPSAVLRLRVRQADRRVVLPRLPRAVRTRFAMARPFNAYGPGEFPESEPGLAHVIPDPIRKILDGSFPSRSSETGPRSEASPTWTT
jgi:UDP-glucose 4-epimerase